VKPIGYGTARVSKWRFFTEKHEGGKRTMRVFAVLLTIWFTLPCAAQLRDVQLSASTPVGGELLLLTPQGPVPSEITRRAGPFLLMVENHSGVFELDVMLTKGEKFARKKDGALPSELRKSQHRNGRWNQTQLLDLEPGTYYLTPNGRESWAVKLTITQ
jgi:hypothetical protein